jgi:hypothetical protein
MVNVSRRELVTRPLGHSERTEVSSLGLNTTDVSLVTRWTEVWTFYPSLRLGNHRLPSALSFFHPAKSQSDYPIKSCFLREPLTAEVACYFIIESRRPDDV